MDGVRVSAQNGGRVALSVTHVGATAAATANDNATCCFCFCWCCWCCFYFFSATAAVAAGSYAASAAAPVAGPPETQTDPSDTRAWGLPPYRQICNNVKFDLDIGNKLPLCWLTATFSDLPSLNPSPSQLPGNRPQPCSVFPGFLLRCLRVLQRVSYLRSCTSGARPQNVSPCPALPTLHTVATAQCRTHTRKRGRTTCPVVAVATASASL